MAPSGPKGDPKAKADSKAKAKPKPKKAEENPEDKIPRVEQPDRNAMEEACKKVNSEVDAIQKKKADLDKRIGDRSTGKEEFFQKKQELRAKLDDVQARMEPLMGKKDELYKQIDSEKANEKQMKEQLSKMKGSLGFSSEADIDKRIAEIEYSMHTSSMTLKEEKKKMEEIKELKKSKPKVSKLKGMEADMENRPKGGNTDQIRGEIKAQTESIQALKEEKKLISAEYAKLNEERQKTMGDMPELFEERTKLQTQMQEKRNKIKEIRDKFREKEKEFNAYMNEIRKIRAEKAAEGRLERQAEFDERRKQRAVEQLDEQPHVAEITLIEQTIAWGKNLLPKEEKKEDVGEKKSTDHNNPEGSMILLKKNDREEEFYYAPTKKKSQKGGKKKEDSAKKTIKHDAATFQLFDSLKLDAPITVDEIPDLIVKLEAMLEDYNKKVAAWEKNREEMKKKILAGEVDEKKDDDKAEEKAED